MVSYLSLLIKQKASPKYIQKQLGHASISTTFDIYGHLMPGWQREAAEVFAKAMGQGN